LITLTTSNRKVESSPDQKLIAENKDLKDELARKKEIINNIKHQKEEKECEFNTLKSELDTNILGKFRFNYTIKLIYIYIHVYIYFFN